MTGPTNSGELQPARKPNGIRLRASAARVGRLRLRFPGRTARVIALIVIALPSLVVSSNWYQAYAAQLPDISGLSGDVPGDTIIYAADGKTVLGDLHPPGYQHYYEPLSAMGTYMPDAIISIEDRNFY